MKVKANYTPHKVIALCHRIVHRKVIAINCVSIKYIQFLYFKLVLDTFIGDNASYFYYVIICGKLL